MQFDNGHKNVSPTKITKLKVHHIMEVYTEIGDPIMLYTLCKSYASNNLI